MKTGLLYKATIAYYSHYGHYTHILNTSRANIDKQSKIRPPLKSTMEIFNLKKQT